MVGDNQQLELQQGSLLIPPAPQSASMFNGSENNYLNPVFF